MIRLICWKLKREETFYYGQRYVKRSELAVESFLPQSYGNFKQRNISKTTVLFYMTYGTKKFNFDNKFDIRDELVRPGRNVL